MSLQAAKLWRQNQRAKGLCTKCTNTAELNRHLCSVCKEKRYVNAKAWRDKRIAQGYCKGCKAVKPVEGKSSCQRCLDVHRDNGRKNWLSGRTQALRKQRKDEVFEAYGGYRCACCGEDERLFLEIDHINNDGGGQRRALRGKAFYSWLRTHGYPSGYQVLCCNCNKGKHRNGGICPHQQPVDALSLVGACG